jgi:hypothetical protein
LELGSVERLSNHFTAAVAILTNAAELATGVGRSDVAFDAWIEIARAHIIGTRDHGAAQAAIDRAVTAAGSRPSPKQLYEIARYDSEASVARGELEAGLVGALEAVRLAPVPDDRFYGELDTGSALEKIAESCDYRQLRDSRSDKDPAEDGWGHAGEPSARHEPLTIAPSAQPMVSVGHFSPIKHASSSTGSRPGVG